MKMPAIKYRLLLPMVAFLLCQCKKETVKTNCLELKLLTDATWYPDKKYDYNYAVFYREDDAGSGSIGHIYNEMYPTLWKFDCNKLLFKNKRNGPPNSCPDGFCESKNITSLTKSEFQLDGTTTLYNPAGEQNGNISFKSDLGDFSLTTIAGIYGGGVHTIFKPKGNEIEFFRIHRVSDKFSQYSITIAVTGINLDVIIYPHIVSTESFTIKAGQDFYKNDTVNSKLTITEFKNDILKGTFSAQMIVNRQSTQPATNPNAFNILEGTFEMKMYKEVQ